jgi:hypothetical protein
LGAFFTSLIAQTMKAIGEAATAKGQPMIQTTIMTTIATANPTVVPSRAFFNFFQIALNGDLIVSHVAEKMDFTAFLNLVYQESLPG